MGGRDRAGGRDRVASLAGGARTPARACLESLTDRPLPLYSDRLDVAVLWNAKAGCTFAVKWLFYHEGILDEALAYSPWVHEYRQQVYCRRPGYADKVRRIPALGPRAIKFVRNPFDRAVSSYLTFARLASPTTSPPLRPILGDTLRSAARFARHPRGRTRGALLSEGRRVYTWFRREHAPVIKAISRHLDRPVGHGEGFTFREFVDALGSLDLDTANPHIKRQIGDCERLGQLPSMTVLRIEESGETLPWLEDELGLGHSDIARLSSSHHHTRRGEADGFVGDIRFDRSWEGPIPRARSFYDDALAAAVERLYGEDIETYGYHLAR